MRFKMLSALAATALTAACAQAPAPKVVVDPYAGQGGGARYQGIPGTGVLKGSGTAAEFRAVAGDTVLFEQDQVTLTDVARATLVKQADWLKRNGSFSSVVEGHSDEQGTREFNLALGARRAGAVQEYLISQGVQPGRVTTSSFGKERPIEVCATPECQARNRRAVTVVRPAAPGV